MGSPTQHGSQWGAPRGTYCHECAHTRGLLAGLLTSDALQTPYQLAKFMKHTVPPTDREAVSIFETRSSGEYEDYVVNAAASGAVEIDAKDRRNIIWWAGRPIGVSYERGQIRLPLDGIKVVLSSDDKTVHAFPFKAAPTAARECRDCGRSIAI